MSYSTVLDGEKKGVVWREWENDVQIMAIYRVIEKPLAAEVSSLKYDVGIQPHHRRLCL